MVKAKPKTAAFEVYLTDRAHNNPILTRKRDHRADDLHQDATADSSMYIGMSKLCVQDQSFDVPLAFAPSGALRES